MGSSPVYDHAFTCAALWQTSRWYHIGDRVKWCGMLLRCEHDHYVGHEAQHPWDPGWGWGDAAARMWRVLTPEFMATEADDARAAIEAARTPSYRLEVALSTASEDS